MGSGGGGEKPGERRGWTKEFKGKHRGKAPMSCTGSTATATPLIGALPPPVLLRGQSHSSSLSLQPCLDRTKPASSLFIGRHGNCFQITVQQTVEVMEEKGYGSRGIK